MTKPKWQKKSSGYYEMNLNDKKTTIAINKCKNSEGDPIFTFTIDLEYFQNIESGELKFVKEEAIKIAKKYINKNFSKYSTIKAELEMLD